MAGATRKETDSLGDVQVPVEALWGAQTQRAVGNFPVSGLRLPRRLIRALALVKKAAAEVNRQSGLLDARLADAIIQAAHEVATGQHDAQFPVDIFQTGSGTSSNMNANEVIANRAIQLLGGRLGTKTPVHPNDHVNKGQSSNDVFPTAVHVAASEALERDLLPALRVLERALLDKAKAFDPIVKLGRTHLMDAVPVRLGQEFSGYARMVTNTIRRVAGARPALDELALGGTAVGTGLGFELSVMIPVMAFNFLQAVTVLAQACTLFASRCVDGLIANEERATAFVEQSLAMATALNPRIGYDAAAAIAREAAATGKTVRQLCLEKKVLPPEELARLLDPRGMTGA